MVQRAATAPHRVPGTYLSIAIDCLREVGAPQERAWPYDQRHRGDEGQGPPPPPVASGDPAYCILRGLEFNRADIAGIKRRIVEGRSVVATMPVFASWYHSIASRRWGKVTLPLPAELTDDGHAMPLVGYQDDAAAPGGGYFIARNAWRDWSAECVWKPGYACVPYAYITLYATDVRSAERTGASDVYVRDTDLDTGRRDGAPQLFASPDIWLRRQPDGREEPERAGPGANAVYVRAHTLGPAVAYRVEVEVLEAPLAPYVPAGEWRVAGKHVGDVAPHGPATFPALTWQPLAGEDPDRCWLVRLNSAVDPLPPLGLLKSNNSAESHQIVLQVTPGTPAELHFMVFSALGHPGDPVLRVERGDLPPRAVLTEPTLEPVHASRSTPAAGGLGGLWEALANAAASLRNRGRMTAHMALRMSPSTRRGATYQWGITQWQGETYLGRLSCIVHVV